MKMHTNEVAISLSHVQQLVAAQFPQWANLPIAHFPAFGTENIIFRLGNTMTLRFPRIDNAAGLIDQDRQWLPKLAPHLPLTIPIPLAQGKPALGYPFHWSVFTWIEGHPAIHEPISDLRQAAVDLAHFILALQQTEYATIPPAGRGLHLTERIKSVRHALAALNGFVDTEKVAAIWKMALQAPAWDKSPVLTHGDLIATNLLVKEGRLCAVLDFGCFGVADPACDLIAAWSVLSAETRPIFRTILNIDDATWQRGIGWALSQALIILPYYRNTNPVLIAVACRMIAQILQDTIVVST